MIANLLRRAKLHLFASPTSSLDKVISVLVKQSHVNIEKVTDFQQSVELEDNRYLNAVLLVEALSLHFAIYAKSHTSLFRTLTPNVFEHELLTKLVEETSRVCVAALSPQEEVQVLLAQLDNITSYFVTAKNSCSDPAEALVEAYIRGVNCVNANTLHVRFHILSMFNVRLAPTAQFFKSLIDNGYYV